MGKELWSIQLSADHSHTTNLCKKYQNALNVYSSCRHNEDTIQPDFKHLQKLKCSRGCRSVTIVQITTDHHITATRNILHSGLIKLVQ